MARPDSGCKRNTDIDLRPVITIDRLLPAQTGQLRQSRAWRNWQTRQTQNLVLVTECRFDPDRPHQPHLSWPLRDMALRTILCFTYHHPMIYFSIY
jgi:hypothetical protein